MRRQDDSSVPPRPVDHVGERAPVQVGAQIVGEHVKAPMLRYVCTAGDMRSDQDTLVLPEAGIGGVLELALVDCEADATQLARCERVDQGRLVDDLAAGDVDQHRSLAHRFERRAANQPRRLRRPLAADSHELALAEQRMKTLRALETAESRRQSFPRRDVAPGADHAHPGAGAQAADRLADPTGADDAHGLAFDEHRPIAGVLETLPLSIAVGAVQAAGEVEKTGQNVFGHGPSVALAARRGHGDVAAPQIAAQQVAGAGGALMEPSEPRRPRPQIERERPAAQDDLGPGQEAVALRARAGRTGALAEIAIHTPLGPGLAELVIEPAARVDNAHA